MSKSNVIAFRGAVKPQPDITCEGCAVPVDPPKRSWSLRGWITARLIRPRVWWKSLGRAPF